MIVPPGPDRWLAVTTTFESLLVALMPKERASNSPGVVRGRALLRRAARALQGRDPVRRGKSGPRSRFPSKETARIRARASDPIQARRRSSREKPQQSRGSPIGRVSSSCRPSLMEGDVLLAGTAPAGSVLDSNRVGTLFLSGIIIARLWIRHKKKGERKMGPLFRRLRKALEQRPCFSELTGWRSARRAGKARTIPLRGLYQVW